MSANAIHTATAAVTAEIADLSRPERIAVLATALGREACGGNAGTTGEKLFAHRSLGQAMGHAFAVVERHFVEGDAR
jgi:hypothetical protein